MVKENKILFMGQSETNKIVRKVDLALMDLYRNLPLSYLWIYRRSFGNLLKRKSPVTMLDIGCGDGGGTQNLSLPKSFEITGVDIFQPYINIAKKRNLYKRIIKADVRKLSYKKKYDVVLVSHILEHMSKEDGVKLINKLENITKKRLIIISPIGDILQHDTDGNKHQVHVSSWSVEDMEKLGFNVKTQGFRLLWGGENIVAKYGILSYLFFIVSYIFSPLLLISPNLGTYMICTKCLKK